VVKSPYRCRRILEVCIFAALCFLQSQKEISSVKYIKKILLHNISIVYNNPRGGLFDFDQKGIFFAESGDVLVTRREIPRSYLSFLSDIGLKQEGIDYVYADTSLPNTPGAIFVDQSIVRKLRTVLAGEASGWTLSPFVLTEHEARWAEKLGLDFVGDPVHYYSFGNKSYFRSLAKRHSVRVPKGFENQKNPFDGGIKATILFLFGASEIVVKQNEGVAGLGSQRFSKPVFLRMLLEKKSHFIENFFKNGVVAVESDGFVVEKWYRDVIFSPSIQLYVQENGEVEIISLHVQLFRENNMTYCGCRSDHWIEKEQRSQLEVEGVKIARVCASMGYRGDIALNAIVLKNRDILWTEINPRKVMSSYPFQVKKRLFSQNEDVHYVSKHIKKPNWKRKTIEHIMDRMSESLFSPSKKSGLIPFDYSLLWSTGQLGVVAFGKNTTDTEELMAYAESL